VDLGVKFQASTNGTIIGIRFYKGPQNTGAHIGDLWTTSGTLLASATFTNETSGGWQQVNFSSPVNITAGTTYIASYEAPVGEYSADQNYFTNALTNGPLTALSSSSSGGNGVYAYGSSNPFPNNTFNASNYWVDVVFSPSAAPVLSNIAASASYNAGGTATTLSPGATVSDPESATLLSATVSITGGLANGDTLAATTTGTSIAASYNASTGVLSLSGSDTLAHYQQVLDSISYSSSSQDPTNSGGDPSRTISWTVNDGTLNSATQTTTVNITRPSITAVALSGGLWQLSGSAAAASTVTVFDGATNLGTTTANSSGSWSFPTNENNSAIRDFTVTAAGNGSPPSAAWFEGTTGADVFSFASEAALASPAAIFGNGGSDTIDLTTPTTLADADFAHAHNILTVALSGASSVTLGTNAAAAGIANVTTGNAATSITDSNTGTLNVNAGALAAGTLLTLSGSEKFAVTGLQGNLAATNMTAALNVTTAAASNLSIATGGGADTITASAMTQGETLTLTGSHAATIAAGGNLAAAAYTGKLTVTASGTASQAITTGSGADSITAAHGADTITAGAGADTINVSGHALADSFVYNVMSDSPRSGHDTITGFLAGTGTGATNDTLDFSAILGPTYSVQALGSTSTKVNPDSIAWIFSSSANQTLAYVNATGGALSQTSNQLTEVALAGNIHLAAANLIG
jgi:hypothetical protein